MGTIVKASALALAVLMAPVAAMAGSLENLERERAILLEAMLAPAVDGDLDPEGKVRLARQMENL